MGFRVLDASRTAERVAWLSLLDQWHDREVYADPRYVALFASEVDRVVALVLERANGTVLMPLIVRPLTPEPWYHGPELWDATSAYGYGGPFCWGDKEGAAGEFAQCYEAWAKELSLIASFSRLSLFSDQLAIPTEGVQEVATNIVRTLDLDEDALWRDFEHKVRKNVKRARRDGVKVELHETGRRLSEFINLYHETMDRRQASPDYYFSEEFFKTLVRDLAGQYLFALATLDGQVVSAELVLLSKRYIYSFLGGTSESHFPARPNDLLKYEIIRWGLGQGKRAFVLGGGFAGEDGILRYKRSFAPDGVAPFCVMKWIHDPGRYESMVAARRRWEEQRGRSWNPSDEFFPKYRSVA